jgi:signal transduction histidine kinase
MKGKLLVQNEGHRNGYPWDEELESQVVRLNEGLEQRLAERTVEMRKQTDQLRAMASKLAQVEQRERGRLAAILHDNLQQLLVAARIQISMVSDVLLPVKERNALSMANEIIRQAIADSHTLTVDLSPPILHGAGLGAALEWLAGRMAELHCFTVNLSIDRRAEPRTESLRILLFETVRELVFNSCKHSGCGSVRVKTSREQNDWVRVVVEDAGKGFDPKALSTSMASGERLGLFSIQQRLAHVGARLTLASEPGVGTRVEIVALIDCRDRVGNSHSEGRTGLEVGREDEAEDAIGVLVDNDRKSCVRPVPSATLSLATVR